MNELALPLPPVVDAHAHIFTGGMPYAAGAWTRPDYDFTAEQFLATLDEQGVAFGAHRGCDRVWYLQRIHAGGAAPPYVAACAPP